MGNNESRSARRRFLKDSAAIAGLAITGSVRSASGQTNETEAAGVLPKDTRMYGERARFETTARWPDTPDGWGTRAPL